jgi:hypothetical protein
MADAGRFYRWPLIFFLLFPVRKHRRHNYLRNTPKKMGEMSD